MPKVKNVKTVQKILLVTGMVLISMSEGFILGIMSGMVAGLQSNDSVIKFTDNQISWLASSIHGTCLCGFALAAVVTEKFGRRRALSFLTTPVVIHWLVLYFEQRFAIWMASTVMLGICFGGVMSLGLISIAEYTSPSIRGTCLSFIISGGPAVGMTIAHVLSTIMDWRVVALIGLIPTTLSAIVPCLWIESPTWLASKGRFQECERAFKALHGHSKKAEKELQLLIELEKCKRLKLSRETSATVFNKLLIAMSQKYFWKIAMIVCVLHVYRVTGGKILFTTFTITILQDITGSSDLFLYTMLVDGFLIFGCAMSCYFNSKVNVRTVLLASGILAIIILFALSACLFFKPPGDARFIWLSCCLLALYYVTAYAGLFPVIETLFAEIFPLELKMYCLFGFGTIGSGLLFLSLQTALSMFSALGYHGVFLLNAVLSMLCLFYLWLYLPETKGRTLQEIELYFKNGTFDNVKLDGEQIQVLLGDHVKV